MRKISIRFLVAGDCAVSVHFGEEISLETNNKVRSLYENLKEQPIEGITEMVPTYCSLMIHYRPEIVRYTELADQIEPRIMQMESQSDAKEYVVEIPLLYGGEVGIDLEDCAKMENMSVEEFIKVHSQSDYYVYMLGFAPGHAYTARFENPFHFKRRNTPRVSIPGNCVVVAGNQSNMIPFQQPCGWNIIGALPVDVCDYNRADPFLVHAGDWVRYIPINETEYRQIRKQVLAGSYQCRRFEREVKS